MEIRKSGGNVRGREVFKRSGKRLKLFLAVFLLMFSGVFLFLLVLWCRGCGSFSVKKRQREKQGFFV